jgi:hypothetical protein
MRSEVLGAGCWNKEKHRAMLLKPQSGDISVDVRFKIYFAPEQE